jgi:hypothetical protein
VHAHHLRVAFAAFGLIQACDRFTHRRWRFTGYR